jgi:hypothetical protein
MANTLAYYDAAIIADEKRFIAHTPVAASYNFL